MSGDVLEVLFAFAFFAVIFAAVIGFVLWQNEKRKQQLKSVAEKHGWTYAMRPGGSVDFRLGGPLNKSGQWELDLVTERRRGSMNNRKSTKTYTIWRTTPPTISRHTMYLAGGPGLAKMPNLNFGGNLATLALQLVFGAEVGDLISRLKPAEMVSSSLLRDGFIVLVDSESTASDILTSEVQTALVQWVNSPKTKAMMLSVMCLPAEVNIRIGQTIDDPEQIEALVNLGRTLADAAQR